jgi:hypothetical protein
MGKRKEDYNFNLNVNDALTLCFGVVDIKCTFTLCE